MESFTFIIFLVPEKINQPKTDHYTLTFFMWVYNSLGIWACNTWQEQINIWTNSHSTVIIHNWYILLLLFLCLYFVCLIIRREAVWTNYLPSSKTAIMQSIYCLFTFFLSSSFVLWLCSKSWFFFSFLIILSKSQLTALSHGGLWDFRTIPSALS